MTACGLARRPHWRLVAAALIVCLGAARSASAASSAPPQQRESTQGDPVHTFETLEETILTRTRAGQGADDETRGLAERARQLAERTWPAHDSRVRRAVGLTALVAFSTGSYAESVRLYRRALTPTRAGATSVDVIDDEARARLLDGYGQALGQAGQHRNAVRVLGEALDLRVRARGPDHPDVATVLEHLAAVQLEQGERTQARTQVERALEIREAHASSTTTDKATTGTTADPDPFLGVSLSLMGDVLWIEGQFAQAERWYARAVCVSQRTLGPLHPLVALQTRNYANAIRRTSGDAERAGALLQWSVRIAERALGPAHPEVNGTLNDLAVAVRTQGDYRLARQYYERSMRAIDTRLGASHLWAAAVRHNLALLCQRLGDLSEAIRLERQAEAIWTRTLGATHADVGRAASALGGMYADAGFDERARRSYLRAITIRELRDGPNHANVAVTRGALADLLIRMGRFDAAWTQNARALAIWEAADAKTDPWFLGALATRGRLQAARGDLAAARATLASVVTTQARVFGPDNPDLGRLRITFGELLAELGSTDAALAEATQAESVGRAHLQLTMRDLSERVALGYAASRPKGLDLAASIITAPDGATSSRAATVFDALVRSRGVVLDEMAARHRGEMAVASPEMAARGAALSRARQRLANLIVRGPENLSAERYQRLVDGARVAKEAAERALADVSDEFRASRRRGLLTLDDVRAALPADAALVSFLRFEGLDAVAPRGAKGGAEGAAYADARSGGQHSGEGRLDGGRASPLPRRARPAYVAFVVRAGSADVAVVPLGEAAAIEADVRRWRAEVRTGLLRADRSLAASERAALTAGRALRRRVWDPLTPHLHDASRLFIVPDGVLHLVSFAALPLDSPASTFLVETGPALHYLATERDLVPPDAPAPVGRGLLALGAPAFGAASVGEGPSAMTTTVASMRAASTRGASDAPCLTLQSMRFEALPGSLREIEEVARIWSGARSGDAADALGGADRESADLLSRAAASERAFKQGAPGRRVLHLATHGFFLDAPCAPASRAAPPASPIAVATAADAPANAPTASTAASAAPSTGARNVGATRAVGGLSAKASATRPRVTPIARIENPLMSSGLAFAGVNRRARLRADEEDGLLTAEEVAGLDLRGVEWAVLSACDTGVGAITSGEGVFGLRRAFQIAGVRTVILSLWAVEDRSAVDWMRVLYERRRAGADTTAAVRAASLELLRQRRARGASTHPFFWAGFVASGDWR